MQPNRRLCLPLLALMASIHISSAQTEYTADGTPTALEEELRWLTNRARFDSTAENALRGTAYTDVPATACPLAPNQRITTAARRHTLDLAASLTLFQHETVPGSAYYNPITQPHPWDRMTAEGYAWSIVAENLDGGAPTAEEAHVDWWNSTGHRLDLMMVGLREIGCGYTLNTSADYWWYYTVDFGASGTNHFFTDTLFKDANGNGKYDDSEGQGALNVTLKVNGIAYTNFDVATAVGSFAIPLNSIATGATVEVSIQNPTAAAAQLSIPRNFQTFTAISFQPGQTRVIGTFTKTSGAVNVGFRNLTPAVILDPTATPVFSPASGEYPAGQAITITGATGATIYYRLNGGTEQSAVSPITGLTVPAYPATLAISAYARKAGNSDSATAQVTYTSPPPPTATPVFSPASGEYPAGQAITITGATGATIFYRLNGGTEQSAVSPITGLTVPAYPATLAISAFARKAGNSDSATAEVTYTVLSPFETWVRVNFPGVSDPAIVGPEADPDHDGQANFVEFALGGNPNQGAANARLYLRVADSDDPNPADELLLTIAVRAGTPAFTGAPSPSATQDGYSYIIQGSSDLIDFNAVVHSVGLVVTGLPTVPSGYEYRTFSLGIPNNGPTTGFLRVRISPAP